MAITIFQATGRKAQPLPLSLLRKGSLDVAFMIALNRVIGINGIAWATPFADWLALLISIALNILLSIVGTENLSNLVLNRPVIGEVLAGLIGLIPNCAASIALTQLYLEGVMSAGAMVSGLMVGAGVGLLVLFRTNRHTRQNIQLTILLYILGVAGGLIVQGLRIF